MTKWEQNTIRATLGLFAGLMAAGLIGCGQSETNAEQGASAPKGTASAASAAVNPALTVSTVLPESVTWPIKVTGTGSIAAWQEGVVAAEVGGLRIEKVFVEVGDVVKKGAVLALLRQDSVRSELALAKAALSEAQAMLAEARANAGRARALQPTDMISKQDALRATTAEQTAAARVESAQAQLAATQLRLDQTQVLAPDDGVVSARSATVGAVVQAGQELFKLVRRQRLEWRAEVAAADLPRLKPGMSASLVAAGGAALQGKIRIVSPTVEAQTRNGLIYVDLDAAAVKAAGVRPGVFANGHVEVGQSQGLTVPQTAVQLRDGFAYVARLTDGNKVALTKVQVGRRVDGRVEVLQGLDAKTPVVASGVGFLTDGDTVHVVSAAAAKP